MASNRFVKNMHENEDVIVWSVWRSLRICRSRLLGVHHRHLNRCGGHMVSSKVLPFPHATFPCGNDVVIDCLQLKDKVVPQIAIYSHMCPCALSRVRLWRAGLTLTLWFSNSIIQTSIEYRNPAKDHFFPKMVLITTMHQQNRYNCAICIS